MKTLLCVSLLCLSSGLSFALDYSSAELRFKARLPDNLEDVSIRVGIRGALITLGKWNPAKNGLVKIVSIQDLGGPIGRKDLSKRQDKPANAALEKATWKTYQIDVFRVVETEGGITNVTFNAQVPLAPHAIQITVMGPIADESALREELQAIVTSIYGETSWLSAGERIFRGASGVGLIIAGVVVGFILLIVVINVLARRPWK